MEEAKKTCKDPVVLIEQRLDFSRFVEEGFGTGDCVIIADGTLYIILPLLEDMERAVLDMGGRGRGSGGVRHG